MYALIFLFFFSSSFARDLVLVDKNKKYLLSFSEEKLSYKDELTELSLIKKKCNAAILEKINKTLDQHLEKPFLNSYRPEFYQIKIDGKILYGSRFEKRAIFFLGFPEEMKKLKLEEEFNCTK